MILDICTRSADTNHRIAHINDPHGFHPPADVYTAVLP